MLQLSQQREKLLSSTDLFHSSCHCLVGLYDLQTLQQVRIKENAYINKFQLIMKLVHYNLEKLLRILMDPVRIEQVKEVDKDLFSRNRLIAILAVLVHLIKRSKVASKLNEFKKHFVWSNIQTPRILFLSKLHQHIEKMRISEHRLEDSIHVATLLFVDHALVQLV